MYELLAAVYPYFLVAHSETIEMGSGFSLITDTPRGYVALRRFHFFDEAIATWSQLCAGHTSIEDIDAEPTPFPVQLQPFPINPNQSY